MTQPYFVYLEDQLSGKQRLYENPLEIITANTQQDVPAALKRIAKCRRQGLYIAGYFAYELGYVLEPCLSALLGPKDEGPLLQFGVFSSYENKAPRSQGGADVSGFSPLWSEAQYLSRFEKIMAYIRAGDVYQINLSFPVSGQYKGSAMALYNMLKSRQPVRYGGVINLGGAQIVSLSPELFFETTGPKISMRPMKGTIKRGAGAKEDEKLVQILQSDAKNRAENLMIVDLLRNDMSRISKAGSVNVTDLFSVETYPSLHTMTSGIEAELNDDVILLDIVRSLFPCGSVTGAPKIRAMQIIDALERRPRGAYCGALGLIDPNGDMRFNVGIRTLTLKENGEFTYPIGSGVVSDSSGEAEYAECLLKAAFLRSEYQLFETLGWDEITGFMHLDLHLERLQESAKTLGFKYNQAAAMTVLNAHIKSCIGPQKVRLSLALNGDMSITSAPLRIRPAGYVWTLALCKPALKSANPLLAHKTSRRSFIEGENRRLSAQTGCMETLFFNERDEVCEGSFTNVFVVKGSQMYTPPLSSGLLPGVFRRVLIANNEVQERVLTVADLREADALYIGNSVRGLMRARLANPSRL